MKVAKVPAGLEVAPSPEEILRGKAMSKGLLGPWSATSICGNNITSSCLYVLGMVIVQAQALAPLALLLAAGVLYLYRKIYTEVVEAIPLDGGAYNCLLNCTRKFNASFAASFTLLSYLATAIISATIAATYGQLLFPSLPLLETTVLILVLCAGLTLLGPRRFLQGGPGHLWSAPCHPLFTCSLDIRHQRFYLLVANEPEPPSAARRLAPGSFSRFFRGYAGGKRL